jgi:hypothetical protein
MRSAAAKRSWKRRLRREHRLRRVLVRARDGVHQSDPPRAPGDEQIVDTAVIKPQRDLVRRHADAERPAINREGRDRWIPGLVDASGDAGWIGVEQAGCQRYIPETGGHEDVGRRPALE